MENNTTKILTLLKHEAEENECPLIKVIKDRNLENLFPVLEL